MRNKIETEKQEVKYLKIGGVFVVHKLWIMELRERFISWRN